MTTDEWIDILVELSVLVEKDLEDTVGLQFIGYLEVFKSGNRSTRAVSPTPKPIRYIYGIERQPVRPNDRFRKPIRSLHTPLEIDLIVNLTKRRT